MTEEISPEDFAKLEEIAMLALSPEEANHLRRELNYKLKIIRQLPPLETSSLSDVEAQPTPTTLRPDEWMPCENPDDILDQAPQVEGRYFVVSDSSHTELD